MLEFVILHGFLISQILVWIAIFTDFLSFQFKDRKKVLLILTVSSLLIALHYLLLWEINAFYLVLISMVSFLVSAYTYDKKIMLWFFILYLVPIVLNYSNLIDIILFIAMYIMLFAKFIKDDKYIRIYIMLATCFGLLFNILIWTPVWILLQILFLWSNIIWYYKHYLRNNKELLIK
jgi:hypothetical protein